MTEQKSKEIWKIIDGYPEYKISNHGNVYSITNQKHLKPVITDNLYIVNLFNDGNANNQQIHRLVAKHFLKNFNDNMVVKHKDGNTHNNYYKNLTLITREDVAKNTKRENNRVIIKCDLNGNELQRYNTNKELLEDMNINDNKTILKCINGKKEHAYGYTWKLEGDVKIIKADKDIDLTEFTKIGELDGMDFSHYGINKNGKVINFNTKILLKEKIEKRGNPRFGLTIDQKQHYYTKDKLLEHVFNKNTNIDIDDNSNNSSDIPEPEKQDIWKENGVKWTYIKNYEGKYKISEKGDVYSISNNSLMTKQKDLNGYYKISLSKNRICKQYFIHRLIVSSFIGPIPEDKVVDHIDRDKTNNNIENLRIVTQKINSKNRDFNNKVIISKLDIEDNLIKIYNGNADFMEEHNINCTKFLEPAIYGGETVEAHGFKWKCNNPLPPKEVKKLSKFKSIGTINGQDFSKYGINKKGDLCNLETKRYIVTPICSGYHTAKIQIKRKTNIMLIHKLVMKVFGEDKHKEDHMKKIRHVDGDKLNNHIDNLEWF